MAVYHYEVECMTHQVLYQTVEFTADHELNDEELEDQVDDHIERNGWEPQKPSTDVDIDHVHFTVEQEEPQHG